MHLIRKQEEEDQMKKAADELYEDYLSDKELTAFTNLDFESFYETRWNLVDKSWPDRGNWDKKDKTSDNSEPQRTGEITAENHCTDYRLERQIRYSTLDDKIGA